MDPEEESVLNMLERGQITAAEADNLLDALETEDDTPPPMPALSDPPDMSHYRAAWRKPFNASLVALGVSGGVFLGLRGSRSLPVRLLRLVALPVALISAVAAVISYWSKDAPWVHVRVREAGKQQVAVSLPLPLNPVRQGLNWAKGQVQDAQVAEQMEVAAEFLEAFDVRGARDPLTINVDEDNTQVEVYIG